VIHRTREQTLEHVDLTCRDVRLIAVHRLHPYMVAGQPTVNDENRLVKSSRGEAYG
jgi:hypothetical protein